MSKRERAAEMRAQGLTYREIGEALGVHLRTAYRWLNPDYDKRDRESAQAYKDRNRDAVRAANIAYRNRPEQRGRCVECGELRGNGAARRGEGRCANCCRAQAERRAATIIRLFESGLTLREIAERVGSTPASVGVALVRLRREGRVGYRYAGCADRAAA